MDDPPVPQYVTDDYDNTLVAGDLEVQGDIFSTTLSLSAIAAEASDVDKFLVDSSNLIKYRTGVQVLSDIGGQIQGSNLDNLRGIGTNSSANEFIVGTGEGTIGWKLPSAVRTSLGLVIGTDVQAYVGYIKLSDTKAQNTDGGTFTQDAWRTRVLTTEDTDTNNDCTLNANQITLAAGTYECLISCPAVAVDRHQTRLYNTTGAAVVLLGTSEFTKAASVGVNRSFIIGRFTIAAGQALEIQHYCGTTAADLGFGVASNLTSEVYTIAEFRRVN